MKQMRRFPFLLSAVSAGAALVFSACAPFPVPADWPVALKEDRVKVRMLENAVANSVPVSSLTRQERSLLTFLSDNQRVNEAIGKEDRYGGTASWKIAEIFIVEPGRRVSVLCEEGHYQEPLYFRYNPDNQVWYRVEGFDDADAAAYPALIVRK